MAIEIGQSIPDAKVQVMTAEGPEDRSTVELFAGKNIALFAVPGAFTPTCSVKHLPGFLGLKEEFEKKGVHEIICMSVNDVFVMDAWSKDHDADGKVTFIADGVADFTKALGVELDLSAAGLGLRSKRFSLYAENGVVKALNLEEGGGFEVSSAEQLLEQI